MRLFRIQYLLHMLHRTPHGNNPHDRRLRTGPLVAEAELVADEELLLQTRGLHILEADLGTEVVGVGSSGMSGRAKKPPEPRR